MASVDYCHASFVQHKPYKAFNDCCHFSTVIQYLIILLFFFFICYTLVLYIHFVLLLLFGLLLFLHVVPNKIIQK